MCSLLKQAMKVIARNYECYFSLNIFLHLDFVRAIIVLSAGAGPAGAVEEHQTMKREDPGSTPDEGSKFLNMKRKIRSHKI